jgi:hypothetical protein
VLLQSRNTEQQPCYPDPARPSLILVLYCHVHVHPSICQFPLPAVCRYSTRPL